MKTKSYRGASLLLSVFACLSLIVANLILVVSLFLNDNLTTSSYFIQEKNAVIPFSFFLFLSLFLYILFFICTFIICTQFTNVKNFRRLMNMTVIFGIIFIFIFIIWIVIIKFNNTVDDYNYNHLYIPSIISLVICIFNSIVFILYNAMLSIDIYQYMYNSDISSNYYLSNDKSYKNIDDKKVKIQFNDFKRVKDLKVSIHEVPKLFSRVSIIKDLKQILSQAKIYRSLKKDYKNKTKE